MAKRIAWVLLLIMVLGGCAARVEEEESQEVVIGFSQLGSESAWRLRNTRSLEQAAEAYGFNLMVDNALQKQENQIAAIRSFIAYRVDVIVFAPIVEDGWDNVLTEAKAAGIPVILTDRHIRTADENLYTAYVGGDMYHEGVRAGQFLLRKAEEMEEAPIRIVEISGTEGSTPALGRYSGFHDTVDGDDRFVTLETVSGDFLRSKGKECMEYLLDRHGEQIDVLFSHNDAMTLGAIEAIEKRGFLPGQDIVIITVDGEQAAVDLLRAGKINCVVECTPLLGELVMGLVDRLVRGETVPRVTHPEETNMTEFDDLTKLVPRGF